MLDIEQVEPKGEPRCTFGSLFNYEQTHNHYEALFGTLKAAKKRNLIDFQSSILLKGIHDDITIRIVQQVGSDTNLLHHVESSNVPIVEESSNPQVGLLDEPYDEVEHRNHASIKAEETFNESSSSPKQETPGKNAFSFLRSDSHCNDDVVHHDHVRDNSNSINKSSKNIPDINSNPSDTQEGCYLLFDEASGGTMKIQYSKTKIQGALGFWKPGKDKKIQPFKFIQNQGRSDLLTGIAGKDYRKKYFSAVAQFVKAARMHSGFYCKWSEFDRVESDVYIFYNDNCEVKRVQEGMMFDVSEIDAVAVVPKGNSIFVGVHTGEYGVFLGRGDSAGASLPIFNS